MLRAATDADIDLLFGWHADPEISRYWDDEIFTAEEIASRLRRERVDAWIIEAEGEPVGYLQSWWEADAPLRGGLDGFLIPGARGRGLMPAAASALAQLLLDAGWAEVTVDPYACNTRALRGWAKTGFVELARNEPDGQHAHPWVLMRFSPRANRFGV